MKVKTWMNSPWKIPIGTAIFATIFGLLLNDYSKNKPMLSTIWQIVKGIWNFIISVLNFNLKVWWLLMGIMGIIVIIYLIVKFKQEEVIKPDFYDYREEKFNKWKWSWKWKWNNSENAWVISDLTARCPNCDTPLIDQRNMFELSFICPRCNFRASDIQCVENEPHKIERVILDNIDRKRRNQSM